MEKREEYVLISGASSGIGMACAIEFAKNGFNLILTARRNERLIELKKELISNYEIDIISLNFDVRDKIQVQNQINTIPTKVKKNISILINNAGLALGRSPIDSGDLNDWEQMIDTNVKGLLYLSKEIIPIFKTNRKGHIINLSSIAGKEVYPEGNVYCASKHAVDALSKAMRIDLVKDNIKVTNIAPGAVNTEFSLVRYKGDQQKADATYNGFNPLLAKDIANTIYYVSSLPDHVTINDLTIMPTAQASAAIFNKN